MLYTYQHNGTTHTLNLEPQPDGTTRVTIGDTVYTVTAQRGGDGGLLLTIDGTQTLAYTASNADERYIHLNGEHFTLTVPPKSTSRQKRSGTSTGSLTAQMPGQIREVLVSEGDSVERGQTLLIMEAMKMEIRVAAPNDGTAKKLLVSVGDVVERGQTLIEIG